ncbi:MAG: geranylgeranyl diphosphate synthase, type [Gemmatimonadaceae bacterium]|nr:geranylgeranyl diphosphate synthase, type [Gemmatimonadaceae bacterium]
MPARFDAERESVERRLEEVCGTYLSDLPTGIADAIRYGLNSPGKRIRPMLLLYAYRAVGGGGDATLLACGPEIIHAYSLVHDDLPCMDDDDMRRGRPTVHKMYGSRTAIIAGVAMIPIAAVVVRDAARRMRLPLEVGTKLLQTLLEAGGASGMIGGQARDLAGEGLALSLTDREEIHRAKTGALIVASLVMGALAGGASPLQVIAVERYGRAVGLAFQIMDDILDVTSTSKALGKTTGRDVALGKSSFPALLGVEGAQARARDLIHDGLHALAEQKLLTQELSQVANFMVTRTS